MYKNPKLVRSYQDLVVWQKGIGLVKTIYSITSNFPTKETYGLASQLQRAAVSIPSNIAEGCAKNTTKEFIRFISISMGSIAEVETQVVIAKELNYLDNHSYESIFTLTGDINKMLVGLKKSLREKTSNTSHKAQVTNHTEEYV